MSQLPVKNTFLHFQEKRASFDVVAYQRRNTFCASQVNAFHMTNRNDDVQTIDRWAELDPEEDEVGMATMFGHVDQWSFQTPYQMSFHNHVPQYQFNIAHFANIDQGSLPFLVPEEDEKMRIRKKEKRERKEVLSAFTDESMADDEKTTIMVRNIPCRYMQQDLVDELQQHVAEGQINFLYLPMDARKKLANMGYAFMNFWNPVDANAFFEKFKDYHFQQSNSAKRGQCGWAHVQGLEKNMRFYEPTWMSDTPHKPWLSPSAKDQVQPILDEFELASKNAAVERG